MSEYIYRLAEDGPISGTIQIENCICTDEQVIRCRDCKHSGIDQSDHEYRAPKWCRLHEMDVRDESFCAWAERRQA